MRGSLSPDTFARVLRGVAVSRKEGVLHVSRDGVSKRVYFKEGSIVFAGSDDEQERLGEVLVRAGKIKRSDLELALKVLKETGESLGKTLVDMGLASEADIETFAEIRTKSILSSIFSWPDGTFYFEERPTAVRHQMARQLSIHEAILDGVRSIEDREIIRRGVGDLKAVLRQPVNPLVPYGEGSLSSSVEWLLYQANGVSTIEEILVGSPLDENRTLQSIYGLVLAGILEIESPEMAVAARTERTRVALGGENTSVSPGPSPIPSPVPIPRLLGRYEVERALGRGAMGTVYVARDPTIDRSVAIKLIQTAVHLSPSELEKYRERFYREAKAAGKLLHPGIVTVFDVGHTDDATPFIVMEYVEGRTLGEILKTEKPERSEIVRLSGELLEALGFAHGKGVVHRDIKPANVLVTAEGRVKIMDFGIAHVVGSYLTQADDVLGSPNYMAPEQLGKGVIDPRTDLFAFGVVLYRMLTGTLPFRGDSFASIAKAVLFDEPPRPASLDASIPVELSDVVVRCLAKDPANRFATAGELKQALDSKPSGGTMSARSSTGTHRLASRWRWAFAGAGALALAVGGFVLLSRATSTNGNVTPPPEAESVPLDDEPQDSLHIEVLRSEAELYHEAGVSFERGELDASKRTLEMLIRRNPGFEGAPELLVRVNERLRGGASSSVEAEPAAVPAKAELARTTEAGQLFYDARVAFENGDLDASKGHLESILRADPSFEGASELLVKVNDAMWSAKLPLSYQARHNHRIGSCTGTLTLAAWGIRFSSSDHDWRFNFDAIRVLDRTEPKVLNLETFEGDVLALGRSKNYRFELTRGAIRDDDWARFERLAR